MRELSSNEMTQLKHILLDMLTDIDSAFKKHNIRYTLMFGTLLGAVRHGGFIPWDDDIDIAVPRKDYNHLLEHFTEIFPSEYELLTPETCHHFEFFFSKIHKKSTSFIEVGMGKYHDRNTGVFIDVFPLDGVPDGDNEHKKYIKKYQKLLKLNMALRFDSSFGKSKKAKFRFALFAPLRLLFPYDHYYKKYLKYVTAYSFDECNYCSYPSTVFSYDLIFDKKMFYPFVLRKFEDHMFYTPCDPSGVLTQSYGDYMVLPPKEKQVPKHFVEYISFEKPFSDYKCQDQKLFFS